jgi:hypothetical protein
MTGCGAADGRGRETQCPEEAVIAWDILKRAWKKYPEVQVWLIGPCA